MRAHLDMRHGGISQAVTQVSVGSQQEFSTIQSKFGHITEARGRESPDEPHYHIPSLWPFSSSITTLRTGPIWLLMSWSGGKTCNKPCYVIIESHRINPCQTVLQREDINSWALQAAGRELQVSPGSLTVLWGDPGSGAGIVFSSHLILQPTTVITWRHIRRFIIKLNLSVLLINSQYNLRRSFLYHIILPR